MGIGRFYTIDTTGTLGRSEVLLPFVQAAAPVAVESGRDTDRLIDIVVGVDVFCPIIEASDQGSR